MAPQTKFWNKITINTQWKGWVLIPVSIQLLSYILICHILCHGIKWTQKLCAIQLTYTQLQCIWICEENLIGSTEFIFKNYVLNYNVSLILRSYKWLGIDLSILVVIKDSTKNIVHSVCYFMFFFPGIFIKWLYLQCLRGVWRQLDYTPVYSVSKADK